MIDAALRLEEYLDQPILMPIDPFAPIQKIKNTSEKRNYLARTTTCYTGCFHQRSV